jgi:hypothetical protein
MDKIRLGFRLDFLQGITSLTYPVILVRYFKNGKGGILVQHRNLAQKVRSEFSGFAI